MNKKYRCYNRLEDGVELVKITDKLEDATYFVMSGQCDFFEEIDVYELNRKRWNN